MRFDQPIKKLFLSLIRDDYRLFNDMAEEIELRTEDLYKPVFELIQFKGQIQWYFLAPQPMIKVN